MIAPASANAALETLWQVMVEMAEAANDSVVLNQRTPTPSASATIAQYSADLVQLASAANVLVRFANTP